MNRSKSMVHHYHLLWICLLLLVTVACSSSDPALTNGIATLSWDANREPNLAGYKVYQTTTSGTYGAPLAILTVDVTKYTVSGLEGGVTHFFAVTAYNSNGAESSFSSEVSKHIL